MRLPGLLLALCAPLVAPALALAGPVPEARTQRIVPQVSIRGIALGMTAAEVRAVLGAPSRSGREMHPILGRTTTMSYGLTHIVFDGVRASSEVVNVDTTSRAERTVRGVGIGSTAAAVRERVDGARCRKDYGYPHCVVGQELAGRTVTDFSLSLAGRVKRVALALVID